MYRVLALDALVVVRTHHQHRAREHQTQWPRSATWLTDVIDRMARGHPTNRLIDLLPRNYTPNRHTRRVIIYCGRRLTLTQVRAA